MMFIYLSCISNDNQRKHRTAVWAAPSGSNPCSRDAAALRAQATPRDGDGRAESRKLITERDASERPVQGVRECGVLRGHPPVRFAGVLCAIR